jgi:2-polyprenyl-3-methyl-5-hydroxy-6-metoxy-1,4-benzoquinol methylase
VNQSNRAGFKFFNSMSRQTFDRNGIASLEDLTGDDFDCLFRTLEQFDAKFRQLVQYPSGYKWPRDPLHTWSRAWEYPYVYHQLKRMRQEVNSSQHPVVMDFGSGVTFFPFAVASMGYHVTCVDIDARYQHAIEKAEQMLDLNGGSVRAVIVDPADSSYGRNVYDAVYSVSVIEHVPSCSDTIRLLADSLKSGGVMIATLDIDLAIDGANGVPSKQLREIQKFLHEHFVAIHWSPTVPPSLMLTSENSPYRAGGEEGVGRLYRFLKEEVIKPMLGRPTIHQCALTCEGWTHRKM